MPQDTFQNSNERKTIQKKIESKFNYKEITIIN